MRPSSGTVIPHSMRTVVDLPAPFGPRSAKSCPGSTEKLRSSTAVTVLKLLLTPFTASRGSDTTTDVNRIVPSGGKYRRLVQICSISCMPLPFETRGGAFACDCGANGSEARPAVLRLLHEVTDPLTRERLVGKARYHVQVDLQHEFLVGQIIDREIGGPTHD